MKENHIKALCIVLTVIIFIIVTRYFGNPYAASRPWTHILRRRHSRGMPHTEESRAIVETYCTTNTDNAEPMPLKKGSCGAQVEIVQRFLNRMCYQKVTEDGYWGTQTEKAITAYCTNASGYNPPIYGKYWSVNGNGYSMNPQQWHNMIDNYSETLR